MQSAIKKKIETIKWNVIRSQKKTETETETESETKTKAKTGLGLDFGRNALYRVPCACPLRSNFSLYFGFISLLFYS